MEYRELKPTAGLREHVECFWSISGTAPEPGPAETIVPDACAELVLHLGERFSAGHGAAIERQPEAVLVGPLSRPFRVARPAGRIDTVGIRFRPGGLRAFVAAPVHELAERATDARPVFGAGVALLAESLAEARSDVMRLERAEHFLQRRRLATTSESALVTRILAARGRLRSDELATAAGVSMRQLERRFRDSVGLSPKRLARIVRFQEVLRRTGSSSDWVAVALDCGYYDQAHLLRDFRELAGAAPSRFSGREGLAGNFVAPRRLDAFFDVGFVQDGRLALP